MSITIIKKVIVHEKIITPMDNGTSPNDLWKMIQEEEKRRSNVKMRDASSLDIFTNATNNTFNNYNEYSHEEKVLDFHKQVEYGAKKIIKS